MPIRVLVACEFSGIVRDAFNALSGFHAMSCDLLASEGVSGGDHYLGDVREILYQGWDLLIAHPPCTYLANSGVRWLHERPGRWEKLDMAGEFFRLLMDAPIPHIAIENPIMHRYGVKRIGRRQDQVLQPWQFGCGETKAICLWLKNLPLLEKTNVVDGRTARVHRASPTPDRWKERSRFYPGIAAAMATQWGAYVSASLRSGAASSPD